jgi:hypothetical protein
MTTIQDYNAIQDIAQESREEMRERGVLRMMTPHQIKLARHALGLPNDTRRSYRNYYVVSPGVPCYPEWEAMEREGLVTRTCAKRQFECFHLTHDCAKAALFYGETLDPEDFPE